MVKADFNDFSPRNLLEILVLSLNTDSGSIFFACILVQNVNMVVSSILQILNNSNTSYLDFLLTNIFFVQLSQIGLYNFLKRNIFCLLLIWELFGLLTLVIVGDWVQNQHSFNAWLIKYNELELLFILITHSDFIVNSSIFQFQELDRNNLRIDGSSIISF